MAEIERYFVFEMEDYESYGGMRDFASSHNDLATAIASIKTRPERHMTIDVWDMLAKKCICSTDYEDYPEWDYDE